LHELNKAYRIIAAPQVVRSPPDQSKFGPR
jgi:hypothetical protein